MIYATIILVAAGTVGQVILDAIGIHMHSLKVAGGIILFLFGVQMLFGKMDSKTENAIAGGGARSSGVPAGGAFHRRTGRNDGGDRLD